MADEHSKQALIEQVRERAATRLEELRSSQDAAQSGAIHEETRQEHPKDTRAIEAQYLARGLAERVERLQDAVAALSAMPVRVFEAGDPIAESALVRLEDDDGEMSSYLLLPAFGGEEFAWGGEKLVTLTPDSPIGSEIVGNAEGDDFEVDLPGKRLTGVIDSVE